MDSTNSRDTGSAEGGAQMRFTGSPARPAGVRRMLFRLPLRLYRAHLGFLLGHRFVLINHVGRKTGLPRQVVVEVVVREPACGTVTVAAGFGRKSDWYRNLLAHPEVTIQVGARTYAVRAGALTPAEAAEAMTEYAHRHARAARALVRLMGFRAERRRIDYHAVGSQVPMLRLEPIPA